MAVRVARGLTLSLVTVLAVGVGALADRPRPLPDFALRDPAGRLHTRASLAGGGLVLVVTAPTLASEEAQRAWDALLRGARPEGTRARIAFVEDLEQSWFPDRAVRAMRDEYDPRGPVVVLVDRAGDLRRSLRVARGRTVLLAFDASGRRRFTYGGSPKGSAARRAWAAASVTPAIDDAARAR